MKTFFKLPIGYFLVDKMYAKQQAQLVEQAIQFLKEAGCHVEAVVCDGAFTKKWTDSTPVSKFTSMKNRWGIYLVSPDVYRNVTKTDEVLRRLMSQERSLNSVNATTMLRIKMEVVEMLGSQVFSTHSSHGHVESEDTHPVQVIKQICDAIREAYIADLEEAQGPETMV